MNLIKLNIRGISYSQTQVGAYALILEEKFGDRKIPIIIGNFEAQAIAIALEKDLAPQRPLTHDLFVSFAKRLEASMVSVTIYKLEEGIFYSHILFEKENDELIEIDARTSDAIALALRFDAPIYAYKEVVEKAGVSMTIISEKEKEEAEDEFGDILQEIEEELNTQEDTEKDANPWKEYDIKEIENLMNKAVQEENYELAAELRDELEKRKDHE